MSLYSNLSADLLFFDDEPLDSILYDRPSAGPTSADAFVEIEPILDEIENAISSGSSSRAFALMQWLLSSDLPMSVGACVVFARAFRRKIPGCPKPVVTADVVEYLSVLEQIVDLVEQFEATRIQYAVGTLCYRLLESCGEFEKARALIATMRDRAKKSGESFHLAQLTNNYGYEFLLEGNYSKARPCFNEALRLFEIRDIETEIANAQANLLTCEFALSSSRDYEGLLPTLISAHSVLFRHEDWRVRKTMLLFAKRAEAQGRISVAAGWVRRAVNASREEITQLQQDDKNYLKSLRRKLSRRTKIESATTVFGFRCRSES